MGKVQELERECATLQSHALDRASKIKSLERKLAAATEELDDAREKAASAIEEQSKLAQEKNALINTVKKLNRDNAKLDAFKRNLMQTLQDEEDDGGAPVATTAGDAAGDRLVHSVLSSANKGTSSSTFRETTVARSHSHSATTHHQVRHAGGERSPPRGGSRGVAAAGAGAASPAPSSGGGETWGDQGEGEGGKVDGKEFFRQARARLSYENFSQFLSNIKELNAHKQTRTETLERAKVRSIHDTYFTHRPVSTFDRVPFQLTDGHFLYGTTLRKFSATTAATCTSRSRPCS